MIKKLVTLMTGLDQRKKTDYAKAASGEMTLQKLCEFDNEFKSSAALKALFKNDDVKHIIICIYNDMNGDQRRRMCGSVDDDLSTIKDQITDVANSLNANVDRILEEIR